MILIIFFAGLFWGHEPTFAEAAREDCLQGVVTASTALVRREPEPDAKVVGRIPRGTSVAIRIFDTDWAQIQSGPNRDSFLSRKYLDLSISPKQDCLAQKFEGEIAKGPAILRASAQTGAEILFRGISIGTILEVRPATGDWYEVTDPKPYRGSFVSRRLIKIKDSAVPLPAALQSEQTK